jgi:hypothetical protein
MLSDDRIWCCEATALQQPSHDPQHCGKQYADQNHGGQRKVELKVFPFDPDITGKMTDPVQPVPGKMNNKSGKDQNDSDHDQRLAKIGHTRLVSSKYRKKINRVKSPFSRSFAKRCPHQTKNAAKGGSIYLETPEGLLGSRRATHRPAHDPSGKGN